MSAREIFLKRVRNALGLQGRPGAVAVEVGPRGRTGYQGAGSDPVACFLERFASAGGKASPVTGSEAAQDKIVELVRQFAPQRIVLGAARIIEELDLPARLSGLEMSIVKERLGTDPIAPDDFFAADMSISGVDYLIAETGSLVMQSSMHQSRSVSLLPPLHLAVAETRQIIPDLFDYFELSRPAAGMPSCVTLITGPSKTGDIELRLVTGVHGPGELHLVLIG